MDSWESVAKELEDSGKVSTTQTQPEEPTVAPQLSVAERQQKTISGAGRRGGATGAARVLPLRRGGIKKVVSFEEAAKTMPAFMYENPVSEDTGGMMEHTWDAVKRITSVGGSSLWKGLGILIWGLERLEATIASEAIPLATPVGKVVGYPLRKGIEAFYKKDVEKALAGYEKEKAAGKLTPEQIEKGEKTKEQLKSFGSLLPSRKELVTPMEWSGSVRAALKSWIPGQPVPQEAKSFNDFFYSYYKSLFGIEPPESLVWAAGTITSFIITPALQARILKAATAPVSVKIAALIESKSPALWKRMKLLRKGGIVERVETANDIGKELAQKDLKIIAEQLSEQTGKKIGTNAVSERIAQVMKGSITGVQELEVKANPAINEFVSNLDEIRKLNVKGMAGKMVYTEELTSRQIAELATRKQQLLQQLDKLSGKPTKERLLKATANLEVSGKEKIINDVLALGEKIEQGDLKYIDRLAKSLDIDKATLTKLREAVGKSLGVSEKGISRVSDTILKVRQREGKSIINKLLGLATKEEKAKVTGYGPLLSKILSVPKGTTFKEYVSRNKLLLLAEKLKVSNKKKVVDDIFKIADQVEKGDVKYIDALVKKLGISEKEVAGIKESLSKKFAIAETILAKPKEQILKLRQQEGKEVVNELLNLASKTESQKITGLRPLIKRIQGLKVGFKGKQKLIDEIHDGIQKINNSLYTSEVFGNTSYFPRMYAAKEAEKKAPLILRAARRLKIGAKYLTKRENIAAAVRKEMGEITTAQYPVVKRLIQQGADIETARMFDSVASTPSLASKIPSGKFRQLGDDASYGNLRNMFVHPKVYSDIKEMGRIKSSPEKVFDEAMSFFKLFKVAWASSAHFRNMAGNSILKSLSGMTEAEKWKYGYRAAKEWRNRTDEFKFAKTYFARTTFISEEGLDDILKVKPDAKTWLGKSYNVFKKIAEAPGRPYQNIEFHDKFSLYLKARDMGMSQIEAVEHANKWLFDYGDLAVWEKNIAKRIMPFYTFPRKALPRVAEAAVNNPYALYKYPLMAKVATQFSLYNLNLTDKDYEDIKKVLPNYAKQGSYILMPYRDKNDDLRFGDWTYVIPWGEMIDVTDRGLTNILISNPLFTLVSDIQHNKSSFSGREIWKESDTTSEKTYKSMEYVWTGLVPSLAYKGLYWNKLYKAATGQSRYGKMELMPEALAHTLFGLRTQAIDVGLEQRRRIFESQKMIRELQGKMQDTILKQNNGEITEGDAIKLRQQYLQQIQGYMDKLQEK